MTTTHHIQKSSQLIVNGQFRDAIPVITEGLLDEPNNHELLDNLADCYMETGEFEKAFKASKYAVKIAPWCWFSHFLFGNAAYAMDMPAIGLQHAKKAHALSPNVMEIVRLMAICYNQLGHVEHSNKLYEEAISLAPHFLPLYSELAANLREQGKFEESESVCRRGLAIGHHSSSDF